MARARLGVIARLPEPLAIHVQAWRRALGDPEAGRIGPHLTLAPPQTVAERDLGRAVALVERVKANRVSTIRQVEHDDVLQAVRWVRQRMPPQQSEKRQMPVRSKRRRSRR